MENMGDFNFGDMSGMFNSENMDGAQTMPFANLFGDAGELAVDENESGQKQGKKRGKKGNKRQKDDGKKDRCQVQGKTRGRSGQAGKENRRQGKDRGKSKA